MTVTKDTPHLHLFKSKIDEAINYVSKMPPSEKLRAVQFWNVISEKLQVIVNNCTTDINPVTIKTQENEAEKISLEMNSSKSVDALPNSSISSDFINLSSAYGICSGIAEQYHTVDISNAQLLAPETTFSVVKETSEMDNPPANVPFIYHLNNSVNSCEKISDNYVTLENITQCSCDTLGIDSCVSSDSRSYESNKINDCSPKNIPHEDSDQVSQLSEGTKEISSVLCQSNKLPLDSSHEFLNHNPKNFRTLERKKKKNSPILKDSLMNKKFERESNCDNVSDVNENSTDSDKSDFNSGESDSNHGEPIVSFVVSSSEEILAKNGLTPELVDISGDNKQSKSYTCSDCPAKFSAKGNLIVHMRRHTGEKPYPCAKCSSCFTTKGNLKRHMKTHTGEKPYECTSCGGKFTEKKSLIVHMRRHTGEKPYECKECGKKFAQSGILQTHMAMHLNQKFHLCEHCGKSFRQRSQLQTHKLRHTNVRKYGCSSCSARFLTKGDLERHMRTHTGERPYVCKVCSKAYTRQQSLNEHLNRHYGIRPYNCKYCNKAFTEMSACYKHIKQHEKAELNGPKILSTTSIAEAPKVQNTSQMDSNGSCCEMEKLPNCVSSESDKSELSRANDENIVTNQSLASFIENFFR